MFEIKGLLAFLAAWVLVFFLAIETRIAMFLEILPIVSIGLVIYLFVFTMLALVSKEGKEERRVPFSEKKEESDK